MKKPLVFAVVLFVLTLLLLSGSALAATPKVKLGDDLIVTEYRYLIDGKRVGLVTNQTGVNSQGVSIIDVLANEPGVNLTALYAPEHGLDGKAVAGAYVASYTHPTLGIPVYSLYGATRKPTAEMLRDIDVLLFDIQDIGSRTYTYMSTLNYCMLAAKENGKQIIVLDRPNPVGGVIVDGPVLQAGFETFVGVDNLPMAHGMTAGELAGFFNRKIGADVKVVPMQGWSRDMVFQDTGLPWIPTSPNIPDLDSLFGYMATGLGEGTGIYQADQFKWIGGKGIDAAEFAALMNGSGLPGVVFVAEQKGEAGGVRLQITDYHQFNPARTGFYALCYAKSLNNFPVPKSKNDSVQDRVMFEKIMGSQKVGQWLEQGLTPQQFVAQYTPVLDRFKAQRQQYLIYGGAQTVAGSQTDAGSQTIDGAQATAGSPMNAGPQTTDGSPKALALPSGANTEIIVYVGDKQVLFDSPPFVDGSNRLMVPLRAIAEALGATVAYDEAAREVSISGSGKSLLFTLDSPNATVDGEVKTMDTVPVVKNSRIMVPARYVSEYLGAQVDWSPSLRVVKITGAGLP